MKNILQINTTIPKLFILFYSSVFFIGEFGTMDRLAPQSFFLSILNSLSIVYFLFKSENYTFKKGIRIYSGLFSIHSIYLYYSLILISMIFSLFFAINLTESFFSLSHYFNVIISFFCISWLIQGEKKIKNFLFTLITIIFLIETGFVFYKIVNYYLTYDNFGSWTRTFEIRGFTANINITSFSINYKLPFLFYFILRNFNNKKFIVFASIIIVITILNIFHLASRGGILSMFIVFGIYIFYNFFKSRTITIYLLSTLLLGLSISYYVLKDSSVANPIERTSSINLNNEDGSIDQRLRYYTEVINYVIKNPLIPIGVGMYKLKSIEFDKEEIRQYIVPLHTHNDFLEILIENGIISFLSYIFIFIATIKSSLLNFIYLNDLKYLPIFIFLIIYFLDSSLNFPIARPVSFLFFNLIVAFVINDSK